MALLWQGICTAKVPRSPVQSSGNQALVGKSFSLKPVGKANCSPCPCEMQSVWANEDKVPSIILLHDTTTVQVAWLRTKGKEAQNWWAQLCEQPVPGLTYRLLFKPGCLHPHRWHISLISCLTSLKLVSGFPQRKALEKAERGSFSFLAPFGAPEKKKDRWRWAAKETEHRDENIRAVPISEGKGWRNLKDDTPIFTFRYWCPTEVPGFIYIF